MVTHRDAHSVISQSKPGVDQEDLYLHLANLSLVEDGLERAKTRQSPLRYSYVRDENAVLAARDIPKFLDRAAEVLGRIEN